MGDKIGIFSFGRKQSARCPNKMLRSFSQTTLTDIILKKLKVLGEDAFFAGYEPEFEEKCKAAGVRFLRRDERSINIDEPITEILSFLRDLEYDYFLIVSACLPFLKASTIASFLDQCRQNDLRPAFSVVRKNNFYFTLDRKPLNFSLDLKTINTKAVEPVYEFAHVLYFFNKDYFFTHGRYWDWKEVKLIELHNKKELFDIDTEEDFLIAQKMWQNHEDNIFSL